MAGFPHLDFRTAADWKTRPPHNVSPVPHMQG
jgi:hypothetical protein